MGLATLITFFAVLHRYASGLAIPGVQDWLLRQNVSWAQEATIYLFVWMAKFGAAYGVRTGIHVGVDVAINRMPDRTRARFVLFGLLAGAFFTAVIAAFGASFVWQNGAHHFFYELFGLSLDGPDAGAGHARPRMAHLDRLSGDPARLGADVLSLPAGGVELLQARRTAAPRPRPCRRPGGRLEEGVLEDDAPDLHPRDLKS